MESRLIAAQIITQVIKDRRSLNSSSPALLQKLADPRDRALAQQLAYGTLRWLIALDAMLTPLLKRPLRRKDSDILALLYLGIYQLMYLRIPAHAAVASTVSAARALRKPWATSLVNAVLRQFIRAQEQPANETENDPATTLSHPRWLLDEMRRAWPEHWRQIAEENNRQPPMTLRVNPAQGGRDAYRAELEAAGIPALPHPCADQALQLEQPCNVESLPGFSSGRATVQDAASQLAAPLLDIPVGARVLDACAAPGGKATHIMEYQPRLGSLLALDCVPARVESLRQSFERLALPGKIALADAGEPDSWWDGNPYDRILIDAPCSGTGVIRRHPDIKILRGQADIAALAATQRRLLNALWPLLRTGGKLLYATCSVLAQENQEQIKWFLTRHPDATLDRIHCNGGHETDYGVQILPGEDGMDGFFYARLTKR